MAEHLLMITGSRGFRDYAQFERELDQVLGDLEENPEEPRSVRIIDGDAPLGADRHSKTYCEKWGIERTPYPAAWGDINALGAVVRRRPGNDDNPFYNARAGHDRNTLLARDCDSALAFWDGQSPGTEHAIGAVEALNKPLRVFFTNSAAAAFEDL